MIKCGRIKIVEPGEEYQVTYQCSICGEVSIETGYDVGQVCGKIELNGCPKCRNRTGGRLDILDIGPKGDTNV